jgi:hypothetical protein
MRNFAFYLTLGALAFLTGLAIDANITQVDAQSSKLAITTTALPASRVAVAYRAAIAATGGTKPYSFKASALPKGLAIGESTGDITGTPAVGTRGTSTYTFTVTDSTKPTAQTATAKLTFTVEPPFLVIKTTTLPAARAGNAYSTAIVASGGVAPYAFKAALLPSGLAISKTTGDITGDPALPSVGKSTVDITVTDSTKPTAQSATAKISLTVDPPLVKIKTTALAAGRVGWSYEATVAATYGVAPYTFVASGLPSGLTIDKTTGVITGTPAADVTGIRPVTFKVTDSSKPTAESASASLDLWVYQAEDKEICGQLNLGENAGFNGFVPFAPTDLWDTNISSAPLDPNNETITSAGGFAGLNLHPDFSSVADGAYGIPYVVVDSSAQPLVPINVDAYASESDVALAPFPITASIEGSPPDCAAGGWPHTYQGDAHVLVVDRNTCFLYETFNTHRCNGQWASDSETIWDLKNFEHRPWGWTSADAAGLPIMTGLVRYDEVSQGAINHAIRFTMEVTRDDANDGYFVEPASHAAGIYWGVENVMGMRVRLKSSFDISGFSKANQVILTAMQKYGMVIADNGGYFFFQGAPSDYWDDNDLDNLKGIDSSNFEVVQMTPTYPGWDSGTAPTGAAPTISSFKASATSVAAGAPVTLTWETTNDSYDFIDKLGGVRGPSVVVNPKATTTYTLNATNQYGRSTAAVTVKVE